MTSCTLCDLPIRGDPVTDGSVEGEFCCHGCLEVYRTLGDVPEDATRDLSPEANAAPEVPETAATAFLDVDGMHCKTCEAFIEGTAMDNEGVYVAEASYTTEMTKVTYDPEVVDEADLPDLLSKIGYRASLPDPTSDDERDDWYTFERIRTVLGVLAAMAVMVFYGFFLYPTYLGLYPMSFLYERATTIMVFIPIPWLTGFVLFFGGFPILRGAYVSLKTGRPNMDVLVAFGALAAYVYSLLTLIAGGRVVYFDVTAVIIAVVTAGNHFEWTLKRDAVGSLTDLGSRRTTEARVRRPSGVERVPIDEVEPEDELIVEPGEHVPIDGTVVEGEASVDEALISGESTPKPKEPGEEVISGATVLDRRLVVEVGPDGTSTLDLIVSQMWNIKSTGGGAQRLADRIAAVFVPGVLTLAVIVTLADLALREPVATAVITGVSVLVVSCPCSLGLATPMAVATGVARAAKRGIVVTNSVALESIADIDVVALDKTGTLTSGRMTVGEVFTDDTTDEATLLDRAATVESTADHPVATAIVDAAGGSDGVASDVEADARGQYAHVGDDEVLVGHPATFEDRGWDVPGPVGERAADISADGRIATVVGWNETAHGVVAVADEPRSDWEATVSELAAETGSIVILTGDDQSSVREFESHPDVENVFTGMLPEAKAATIRRLQADHGTVAMVGDGSNDAPALAAADLGIAIANGSELASEAADATILDGGIADVLELVNGGATTRQRIRQNLGWALGYNAVAIPLAVAGLINPLIAAVAMAGSSILVVVNSAR